ncbi:Putative sporulation transcription regulator WhiA [uncultured Roseburia sp.]|uniref:Probable cell division protein WhiA n=1 Tax=Brotonthovivens ammoniilytica TaxID=2981725 RepID=A0ABT2TME3_9FIRM|nr:DNA-binding protein WhiA [Brotonthovivens ammoniilytica]MCU6763257.1 DNA-binding protein WhiA [Brotonthovivens ammoniilytica]SCJ11067.1 Putative sporulation transcription regulator WhiA [uncultured Roseburia sp.]
MSFSSDVKDELSRLIPKAEHCKTAELSAVIRFAGETGIGSDEKKIVIHTENVILAKKYYTLVKKAFGVHAVLNIRGQAGMGKIRQYHIRINDPCAVQKIVEKVCLGREEDLCGTVLKRDCCRRAFIRGAFLASGSMSNPGKSYHLEIVCRSGQQAQLLCGLLGGYGIQAKIVLRKNKSIVYVKESEGIVDLLNLMEAYQASMELENVRIIKDMRNAANRQYNCDAANINKMVQAAARQVDDIRFLKERVGLASLPPNLFEIASVRLEHPDVSLQELGSYLNPPVGKSGVNHRLRKLGAMADELREKSVE